VIISLLSEDIRNVNRNGATIDTDPARLASSIRTQIGLHFIACFQVYADASLYKNGIADSKYTTRFYFEVDDEKKFFTFILKEGFRYDKVESGTELDLLKKYK
jgi:hypothetical protein